MCVYLYSNPCDTMNGSVVGVGPVFRLLHSPWMIARRITITKKKKVMSKMMR